VRVLAVREPLGFEGLFAYLADSSMASATVCQAARNWASLLPM